jgi:hypothetical protein
MFYLDLFNAVGNELFKAATGRLFTEAQITSVSANAIGKYFADFLPEPKDERAARERVEEAREHITKATQIIATLQFELGTQTQQLDAVLKDLEEKKQLAQQYQTLATVVRSSSSHYGRRWKVPFARNCSHSLRRTKG